MYGYPNIINSRADLENLLADDACRAQALATLQTLMDEQYGYDAAGVWGLVGGGGLARLGISRAEATALGALDKAVPEPVFDLAAYKNQVYASIEAERDARLYATFTDSQGVTWIVDDRGRKMLSDRLLLVMSGMGPASWEWTTADGNGVTMTPDTLKTLCAELATWHDGHFTVGRDAVAAVKSATTRAGVDAIVGGIVWPH